METCPKCGERPKRGMARTLVTLEGVTVSADLPSWTCPACKEVYYVGTTAAHFDLLAAEVFGRLGIATGAVFRFMRKALGLRAKDLAEMLGTSAETISRWENGKHGIDRSAIVVLTALVSSRLGHHADAEELLKRYQSPTRPLEPIHLDKIAS